MILLAEKGYAGNLLQTRLRLFDTLDQAVQFCIDQGDNKFWSINRWRFFEFNVPGVPGKKLTKKELEKCPTYAALLEKS